MDDRRPVEDADCDYEYETNNQGYGVRLVPGRNRRSRLQRVGIPELIRTHSDSPPLSVDLRHTLVLKAAPRQPACGIYETQTLYNLNSAGIWLRLWAVAPMNADAVRW